MHQCQGETVDRLIRTYFHKKGKTVYDIGSYDVNGNQRGSVLRNGFSYIGVDIVVGPNVDMVIEPYKWNGLPDNSCDYIISGSCLEHVQALWLWAKELERCLKPGGICVILVPFIREEHRFPVDCYRILPDGLKFLFTKWANLECLDCGFNDGNIDTFFVGRKPDQIR